MDKPAKTCRLNPFPYQEVPCFKVSALRVIMFSEPVQQLPRRQLCMTTQKYGITLYSTGCTGPPSLMIMNFILKLFYTGQKNPLTPANICFLSAMGKCLISIQPYVKVFCT